MASGIWRPDRRGFPDPSVRMPAQDVNGSEAATPGPLHGCDLLHTAVHRLGITASGVTQNACSHRRVHPRAPLPGWRARARRCDHADRIAGAEATYGSPVLRPARGPASMPPSVCSNAVDTVILRYCSSRRPGHSLQLCSLTVRSNKVDTAMLRYYSASILPGPARGMWPLGNAYPRRDAQASQARTGRPRRRGPGGADRACQAPPSS